MADTSALDALAALADELEAAKTALRGYERMLNWHVTCERCAAQLDELYAATVAREVLSAALDSPPGAATLVELATEAARRLTGIADLDIERAAHMQRWAEQAEPMLGIRGHQRECADRAERRRELSRPFLADRERLTGEVAQLREDLSRLASEWERELTSDHRPASALEAELDPAEFRTKPNPDQPDRCPSIDPHDTLQCTRRIHEDGQCQSGGIAWVKGTPRYMSDAERANRMEGMAERLAERLVDVEERLTGERDRARGTAANLEAENARLREGIERLCSDIDNPLRERHDESPHDLPEVAEDLRALLADTDSAQDEGGE